MTTPDLGKAEIERLEALVAYLEQQAPDFMAELDTFNITIDEYDQMLADSEPMVITTDNSVS